MVSKGLCLNASRLMSCLSNARMPLFMLSLLKTLVSSYRWLCLWMLLLPQKEKEKYPNTTLMYFLCLYFLILEVKLMCIHGNVGTFSSWAIYKPKTIDFRLIHPPPSCEVASCSVHILALLATSSLLSSPKQPSRRKGV